jgi:hypothetical protein
MLSIWTIRAAVADGWSPTWPEKEFRSAATECSTSFAAWAYGRSTRNPAPPCQVSHPSDFPAWWTQAGQGGGPRLGDRYHIYPAAESRKDSSACWRSWICCPGTSSAGSSQTSLDTEFCLTALEMAISSGRKPEIFHSDQGSSSPLLTSWPTCGQRRSGSPGQAESAATTTSW